MRPKVALLKKIVLLAIGNFAFVALVFAAFIILQLQQDVQTILLAPARDRIGAIARTLTLELPQADARQADQIVRRLSRESGMDLYLFLNEGGQVGGRRVVLPPVVAEELRRRPPMYAPRPGNPPPTASGPGSLRLNPAAAPQGGPPRGASLAVFFLRSDGSTPYWIGVRMPFRTRGDPQDQPATLFASFSAWWNIPFLGEAWIWPSVIGGTAVISILMWMPLVRGVTSSLGQMMRATSRIADGDFEVKVGQARNDELGLLADSIARMASRLEHFVKGQKRFLGDVAHELRSPLGRMRVASEILARQSGPGTARYVVDIKEDIELMARLTDQLLAFAQAELRPDSISLVPTRVADVVRKAVRIEADGADIHIDVSPELEVMAEPDYLFRSVSNLVRNSLRHAADTPIEITARADDRDVFIIVADSGPGVPDDALERIFEPFFRLDASRQRKTGGAGLGLAIVRTCIEACQGSIECRNRAPSGLSVTLRLARA